MNWTLGHDWTPACMMQMPETKGLSGIGMHVSLLPQPVPAVAPPHAWPVDPHVMAGRLGAVALGVQELPETVAVPTDADTLQGDVPF